jgi:hypothetical protein
MSVLPGGGSGVARGKQDILGLAPLKQVDLHAMSQIKAPDESSAATSEKEKLFPLIVHAVY